MVVKLFGFKLNDTSGVILFFFAIITLLFGSYFFYPAWQNYSTYTEMLKDPFYEYYSLIYPAYTDSLNQYQRNAWIYFIIASFITVISLLILYKTIKQQRSQ